MKLVALVFSMMSFFTSCKCNKTAVQEEAKVVNTESNLGEQVSNLPVVVYQETTRGMFREITVREGKIFVITARGAKPVFWELKKEDYKKLLDLYQKIDLKSLSSLKDPTQKRFYDGAPIATLSFTNEKDTYTSSEFDGGFPPKEIEAFVNELIVVAEKLNK
ncbi:hypothetical protein [Flavobacterium sp. UBA7663]|uniref:hypothetical protein n=1 Tax=Flavobacterium sp. UBA7663 TaxID=1946557 RepID=UPI0025B9A63C|nr:hypothetical protein [Flavobacterium sp. UBA7663]